MIYLDLEDVELTGPGLSSDIRKKSINDELNFTCRLNHKERLMIAIPLALGCRARHTFDLLNSSIKIQG